MSKRAALALLALLGALACSGEEPGEGAEPQPSVSPEISTCISSNPPEAAPAATEDSPAADCRSAGGSGCDEPFISLEAARCIAQHAQLEPGLTEWTLSLTYLNSYRRVSWEVQNVLVDDGPDYSGKSLIVDAVDGQVLGRTSWRSTQ
jgi:hypothetical protein